MSKILPVLALWLFSSSLFAASWLCPYTWYCGMCMALEIVSTQAPEYRRPIRGVQIGGGVVLIAYTVKYVSSKLYSEPKQEKDLAHEQKNHG